MVDVERRRLEGSFLPEVGRQEAIGVTDGNEGGLESVLDGTSRTRRRGVGILNTSELEELLDGRRGNDTGTTGSRNETDENRTALAGNLGGKRVGSTNGVTPVSTADGDDRELGNNNGGANGGGNLLGGLNTKTNVTVRVTNDDNGLEAGALTGTGLLLDGLDLHNLILQGREELVNNLELLNRKRVEVDLLNRLDLAGLHKTAKLGDGRPALLLLAAAATTGATATGATAATGAATAEAATLLLSLSFRHYNFLK